MARLILTSAEGARAVELRAVNSLGRHPRNTIQLLDELASKEHCIVEQRGGEFVLRDLDSGNGTFINGVRAGGEATLKHGDELRLGGTRARFEVGPANLAASEPERQNSAGVRAAESGFLSYDRIANDTNQLRADYERLRLAHELSHRIGLERDTTKLLDEVVTRVLRFITADRAAIFLRDGQGELQMCASKRRGGAKTPVEVSSAILSHVVKERAALLTHDAAKDFASRDPSVIVNRISSAIVAPLLQHDHEVIGVLWLDSETLARFQPKDLELLQTVANQVARFIEITVLRKA